MCVIQIKNPTSVADKIKPWRKEFSNLQEPERSICTLIKSHWKTPLTQTQFPESHQAQTFPTGSLKVQFSHRNICQYWRNIIWCSHSSPQSSQESQADHFTVIYWCACQDSQQDHVFFSWKTKGKKPKFISIILIWHNRTLDRKSVSEILKKVLCFQTEWDRQRKSA